MVSTLSQTHRRHISEGLKKAYREGRRGAPWNKGQTKERDARLAKLSQMYKGKRFSKISAEGKRRLSERMKTRNPVTNLLVREKISKTKCPNAPASEEVRRDYHVLQLSMSEIAKKYGCSTSTIASTMKRNKIPSRSLEEAQLSCLVKKSRDAVFDSELKAYLDGLILGDGTLDKGKYSTSFRIDQRKDRLEWLLSISKELAKHNVQSRIINVKHNKHLLETKCYTQLNGTYQRWYPNGKKVVPKDLVITSATFANWYLSDGSLIHHAYILLCTDAFSREDVDFLITLLNKHFGVDGKLAIWNRRNRIRFRKHDSIKLLKIIEPFKTHCFAYKWDI